MSTRQDVRSQEAAVPTTSHLWHRADAENQRLALAGQPWRTLCGEHRGRLNKFRVSRADMDVCLVCLEAQGGAA